MITIKAPNYTSLTVYIAFNQQNDNLIIHI